METSKHIFIYSWTISLFPETIIYGWGRDIKGRQCVVRVPDFYPWIYILLPRLNGIDWSDKKVIRRFVYWLDSKLPDNCIDGVEYSADLHDLYHYARLDSLKIFFKDANNGGDWTRPATECIADCSKLFTRYVKVEGFPLASYRCAEKRLDSRKEVTLMIQFLSSTGVPMAGWVEFVGVKSINKFSRDTEEWTVTADTIKRWSPPKVEIPDPLILSFDCEMETDDSKYTRFPKAMLRNDRIVQISAIFTKISRPEKNWNKYLLTLYGEKCNDIEGATVLRFRTEKQLLLGFAKLIKEKQPDIRVGHNSFEFDEPYITERCAIVLGIWARWSKLTSRLLYTPTTNENYEWQSGAFGKKELKPWDIPGCLALDTRQVMTREFPGNSSYALGSLAEEYLGESKDPVKPKQIFEWFANQIHVTRIGRYCIKDSVLPLKLIQTLALWDTIIQMADTFRLPILWLYTRGQQLKFRSQLSEECQKYGIIITTKPKPSEGFEGAVVQAAIPGRHLWVLTFDFTSLYPTAIIAYNIDFTTWIRPEKLEIMIAKRPNDIHVIEFDSHVGCKHYPRKNAALRWSYDRTFKGVWREPKSNGKIIYYSAKPNYSKTVFPWLSNDKVWEVRQLGAPDPDFKPANPGKLKDITHNQNVVDILLDNSSADKVWSVINKYSKPPDKKKTAVCGHFKHGFWKQHIRQGVVPRMLVRALKSRTETKNEIKNVYAKLKESIENGEDQSVITGLKKLLISLDKRQLSKKTSSNSMYGTYGTKTSDTPFIEGAACTTAIGRQAIQKAIDFIKDMYPDMELVYGDSVTRDTPVMVKDTDNLVYIVPIEKLYWFVETYWTKYPGFKANDSLRTNKQKLDINNNLKVWARGRWALLKRVIRHKVDKKIYRVQTGNSCVDVTEDHSLLRSDGTKVKPKNIKFGENLLTSFPTKFRDTYIIRENKENLRTRVCRTCQKEKILKEEFHKRYDDYTHKCKECAKTNTIRAPKYVSEAQYFREKKVTPDLAWVWGFFMADGSCGIYEYNGVVRIKYSWAINNSNLEYLEEAKVKLEKEEPEFGFKILDTLKSSGVYKLVPQGRIKLITIKYRELMYLDNAKIVPVSILNGPYKVRKAFFEGYYVGDGCKKKDHPSVADYHTFGGKGQLSCQHLYYLAKSIGYENLYINEHSKKPDFYKICIRKTAIPRNDVRKIRVLYEHYNDYVYDLETKDGTFHAGLGGLILKNTDSCLLRLPSIPVKDIFTTAKHIESKVNVLFPKPMFLEYEKLYKVFFQLTQKRYDGDIVDKDLKFERCDRKGTAMKRRDACGMMKEVYGRILERAKRGRNFNGAKRLLARYFELLANDKIPLEMLTLSSSLKPIKKNENLPQLAVAKKRRARGEVVMEGTRISWILLDNRETSQYLQAEDPEYYTENREILGLRLDKRTYAKKKLANQLDQLFEVGWGHKGVASNLVNEYFPLKRKIGGKRVSSLGITLVKKTALEERWKQVTKLRNARNRHRKYLEGKQTELGNEKVFKMAWKIMENTDKLLVELIEQANKGDTCLSVTWNRSYEGSLKVIDQLGKAVREVKQTMY